MKKAKRTPSLAARFKALQAELRYQQMYVRMDTRSLAGRRERCKELGRQMSALRAEMKKPRRRRRRRRNSREVATSL